MELVGAMEPLIAYVADSLKSQMTQIYHSETHFIDTIQKAFVGQDKIFMSSWMSQLGEPSFIYFLLFPLLLGMRQRAGIKFLGAFVCSEGLNFVLKIFLFGERPYWWIKAQSHAQRLPYLSTASMACKSDPGNPSSFLQTNTVIWYILVATLNDEIIGKSGFGSTSRILLRRNMWKLYGVFLIFLFISEVVSISNFPHQSIFGVVCGIFVINRTFVRSPWMSWRKPKLIFIILVFLGGCYLLKEYAFLITGLPYSWSVPLAKNACRSEEGVLADLNPLLRVARLGGSALGLALSLTEEKETGSLKEALFRCTLGLLLGLFICVKALPRMDRSLLLSGLVHLSFTFIVVRLIPKYSRCLFPETRRVKVD